MQHAVHDRREDQTSRDDEDEPRIQSVETREQLAGIGVRRVDGSHAACDHRGVQEGVAPREPLEVLVARHADRERDHDQRCRGGRVAQQAPDEAPPGNGRFGLRLVHGGCGRNEALALRESTLNSAANSSSDAHITRRTDFTLRGNVI